MINVKKIGISLPEPLFNEAKETAKQRGQTFSGMIRVSLEKEIIKEAAK